MLCIWGVTAQTCFLLATKVCSWRPGISCKRAVSGVQLSLSKGCFARVWPVSGKTQSSSSLFWVVISRMGSSDLSLQPLRHGGPARMAIAELQDVKGLRQLMGAAQAAVEEMASCCWR